MAGNMKSLALAGRLLLVVGLLALMTDVLAQQSRPVFDTNPNLSDSEKRGRHLFLQRCSICHLSHYTKADPAGFAPNGGPSLTRLLKGPTPNKEKTLPEVTLKGTLNMPGFQYGLEPKDLDELIAYIKTL